MRTKLGLINEIAFDTFSRHGLSPCSLGLTHRRFLWWRSRLALFYPKDLKSVFLALALWAEDRSHPVALELEHEFSEGLFLGPQIGAFDDAPKASISERRFL